jgi:DNA-binding response OmpR family regulator
VLAPSGHAILAGMISKSPENPNVLLIAGGHFGGERLAASLKALGARLETAPTEIAAGPWLRYGDFQVVLVDLATQADGGLPLCRRLSADRSLRVIALGPAGDDADIIVTLESGADDYVSRSANPREILARIRAQTRRLDASVRLMSTVEFGGFVWDLRRRQLSTPQRTTLTLSASEASLLMAFLQSGGRNLSREELHEFVSRDGLEVGVRAVDSHVSRLRRKLALHGGEDLIRTVYGFGYRWTQREDASEAGPFGALAFAPHAPPPAGG